MRGQQLVADLNLLRAQRLQLAMAADVGSERLAHLVHGLPTADALGKLVGDIRLFLNANLFQSYLVLDVLAAEILIGGVLAIGLFE